MNSSFNGFQLKKKKRFSPVHFHFMMRGRDIEGTKIEIGWG